MQKFLSLGLHDVRLVVEALRAYAPLLAVDASIEPHPWFVHTLEIESMRAVALADELLRELMRAADGDGRPLT